MAERSRKNDILIIGGGAGGLAAAIAAGREGASVTILEMANRVGRKLLKTGNGRCNLSNRSVNAAGYNHPDFTAPLLESCGCEALLTFFTELGLETVSDAEGRVYPRSDTASSVLDVLRLGAAEAGAAEVCSEEAVSCELRKGGGFRVLTRSGGEYLPCRVIIAAGGGAPLLRSLGHRTVPFSPVLCPLRTDTSSIRGLSGLRVPAQITLQRNGEQIFCEDGEVLFRDYGVSGIVILNASRYAKAGDTLIMDLMPEISETDLAASLIARPRQGGELLTGLCHRRVAEALFRAAGSAEPHAVARVMKELKLTVCGPADSQTAQVTRGGIAVGGIDPLTLQSRFQPGLYVIGEALDIDGQCGGYNLHWAFISGLAAGRSAALD